MRYGRLTLVEQKHINKNGRWISLFQCDCGNTKESMLAHVKRGAIKSCGCLKAEQKKEVRDVELPEYGVWKEMRSRCNNPNNKGYHNYGGRGIKVCAQWQNDFHQFLKDMGHRPSKNHSIEREDNNKGYSKENCKWVTKDIQQSNRRQLKGTKQKYIGVRVKPSGNAEARLIVKGQTVFCETFATEDEAAIARNDFILENKLSHTLNVIKAA